MTLLLLACAPAPLEIAAPPAPPIDEPSYEPIFGEPVQREALYVVAPFAAGKQLQAVELQFDDGTSWIRSYRPVQDELQYVDKRVVVRGRPYENSPYVQSVGGTHFELEHIELAEGETARDPIPTVLPAPPPVRTATEAEARVGRWAHVLGTLTSSTPDGDGTWHEGVLTLADETEIRFMFSTLHSLGHPAEATLDEVVGAEVTVLGQLSHGDEGLRLGATQVCLGEVERCHMTLDSAR